MIILIIIEIEFTALARPISPFRSPVNAGAAAAIGLNTVPPVSDDIPMEVEEQNKTSMMPPLPHHNVWKGSFRFFRSAFYRLKA